MTIKRAIEVLQEFIDLDKELIGDGEPESDFDKFVAERDEACRVAIETMGLRNEKKLYFESDGYDGEGDMIYDIATCPTCGHTFFDGDEGWHCKCCIQCGQALDWSDNDG